MWVGGMLLACIGISMVAKQAKLAWNDSTEPDPWSLITGAACMGVGAIMLMSTVPTV